MKRSVKKIFTQPPILAVPAKTTNDIATPEKHFNGRVGQWPNHLAKRIVFTPVSRSGRAGWASGIPARIPVEFSNSTTTYLEDGGELLHEKEEGCPSCLVHEVTTAASGTTT